MTKDLKAKIEAYIEKRKEVLIKREKDLNDISDREGTNSAAFRDAKKDLDIIKKEIAELQKILNSSQENMKSDEYEDYGEAHVEVGDAFTLLEDGKVYEHVLSEVPTMDFKEDNPIRYVTLSTPLGQAVKGKTVGDKIEYAVTDRITHNSETITATLIGITKSNELEKEGPVR